MSRLCATLLGNSDPSLSLKIRALEQSVGGKKVDVELTAEIIQRTTSKLKAIGVSRLEQQTRKYSKK